MLYGLSCLLLMSGCGTIDPEDERKPVDYTVADIQEIPEDLLELIEQNKMNEMRFSYTEGEYLYLVRGYGEQTTGGYSISVTECTEDDTALWLDTRLLGSEKKEKLSKEPSYPYLVIKMELREKDAMIM